MRCLSSRWYYCRNRESSHANHSTLQSLGTLHNQFFTIENNITDCQHDDCDDSVDWRYVLYRHIGTRNFQTPAPKVVLVKL